ncbi:NAD(P)-dependent alcohol dehydrogenase [Chitinivorax sp. B]|uniref:zinc-dependent alcohol dehydrogenase family protein n=1 Tax=Chitinivorax sp. B TaxID=2502235 RepID=UPI0010F8AFC9|nr:NAD(P)-dependent alcohol dehydrogenase [Chitinivorax sp. B]
MQTPFNAYQLVANGQGNQLQLAKRILPALGPHEVRIRMAAVSLNYRDLLVRQGLQGELAPNLIPLSDGAGTIVEIGSAVTDWRVGDRVSPAFFNGWQSGPYRTAHLVTALGGGQVDGVLSEEVVANEWAIVAVPDHLSLVEAATLPCAAVTAWHALFTRGGLQAGETVLIQGTGGVAQFALQLAVAQKARVIIISSSDAKLEQARKLGAWQTINYRQRPDWDAAVLELTDGIGADHVLELGGPDTYQRSIGAVAAGGRIAQIGVLTGFGPKPDLLSIQFKNAAINGICVGSVAHYAALNGFLTQHRIHPVLDRMFEFDEAPAAYDYLAQAGHMGKVVIRLTDD